MSVDRRTNQPTNIEAAATPIAGIYHLLNGNGSLRIAPASIEGQRSRLGSISSSASLGPLLSAHRQVGNVILSHSNSLSGSGLDAQCTRPIDPRAGTAVAPTGLTCSELGNTL